MKKIWRSLTFNLTQALYPLIPDLYQIFEDLATNQYISAKQIRQLSQNIYIIISAIMLFALGIKLISAIVNPDLLDDKKKGAKQTFFRCVAAVFLIVLIPMGFNKMYDFQNTVAGKDENGNRNQLIEKIILGMDTSNSNNPGQILAAYGFASFCYPNETVSVQSIDENYNQALTEDISKIDNLDDAITSKTDGKWDLNYHPILSPAAGLFLVYEMIVLCMDVALRSIKLALLQLITPIILCAYVLTGNDVLQKYAKEVLSTFALLFLKIAMVAFMIFGLSLLPGFLNSVSADGRGSFYTGILRVFIIIGLFQSIKQLPDILNKIFGTNIKSRGGIRGRLGEMAGVGEMAQKAWDKIKTAGAKIGGIGLATAGLGVPGALALGAGAGLFNHGWKKGFKNKETGERNPWRETGFGRGIRKLGAATKAVGTGLTTKGGIIKSIETGVSSYRDSDALKSGDMIRKLKGQIFTEFGLGDDDRVSAVSKLSTSKKRERTKAALDAEKNADTIAENRMSSGKYAAVQSQVNQTRQALRSKIMGDVAKGKFDSLKTQLETMIGNVTDDNERKFVESLLGGLNTGNLSVEAITNNLKNRYGADDANYKRFKSDAEKFERELLNKIVDENGVEMTLGEKFQRTDSGGFNISTLGEEYKSLTTTYDNRKNKLDNIMETEKFNEEQKSTVNAVLASSEIVYKTVADTTATYNGPALKDKTNPDGTKVSKEEIAASFGDGLSSIPNAQPTSQNSSSTQSSRSDPYEGYGPSTTPSYGDYDGSNDYYNNGSSSGSNNTNNNNSPVNNSNNIGSSDNSQSGGTTVINNNYNNSGNNESIDVKLDTSSLNGKLDDINKSIGNMSSDIAKEIGKQGEALRSDINTLNKNTKDVKKSIDNNTDALDDLNKDE